MNDLEARLRALNFREPPPGAKAGLLAAASRARATWLAPLPLAWAALAACWVALAIFVAALAEPAAAKTPALSLADPLAQPTPLAFHLRVAAGRPPL